MFSQLNIKCTMPASVRALVESGMTDVLSRANDLIAEMAAFFQKSLASKSGEGAPVSMAQDLTLICAKQQTLVLDMAEIIQVNAYVRASVQDGMISALDASIRPKEHVVASSPRSDVYCNSVKSTSTVIH